MNVRRFTVYYEVATEPKQGKAAMINVPRFVNKYGNDVSVPNHTMNMREAISAVRFLMANKFNQARPSRGQGGDSITILEVFD